MTELQMFQVDAFATRAFTGNPAAVCPLERWLPDALLQAIAAENNLAETAFVVPEGDAYGLRWFTPSVEVKLCGHATLATAHVLLRERPALVGRSPGNVPAQPLTFNTLSGPLRVWADGPEPNAELSMDFPAVPSELVAAPAGLAEALGATPSAVSRGRYLICELETESAVRELKPNFALLAGIDSCVTVTARAADYDFVSRFFALPVGIAEDPVTGSAHCELTPYWAAKLGKPQLRARQVSARGGDVRCELRGDRVQLSGSCVTVLRGSLLLP